MKHSHGNFFRVIVSVAVIFSASCKKNASNDDAKVLTVSGSDRASINLDQYLKGAASICTLFNAAAS